MFSIFFNQVNLNLIQRYEGVPGFRRMSTMQRVGILVKTAVLFPFYCMIYYLMPESKTGQLMRRPFMKFLVHASSYLFFLCKLNFKILTVNRTENTILEIYIDAIEKQ